MWGRRAAHDAASVQRLLSTAQVISLPARRQSLADLVALRMAFLTDYQDSAYAQRYADMVERVRVAESGVSSHSALAEAVARNLFKLMAYKDEYEVARLHTQTGFLERINNSFEGDFKVHYHLAPPLLSKRNERGELVKQKFGPIMQTAFKVLTKFKALRGTKLDLLGRTEERQTERALIREYMQHIDRVLTGLSNEGHAHAVDVARVPETIKGYGHVKERNIRAARSLWAHLATKEQSLLA
jgi:indolepyruvate ferredoxin oxidoreductase